MSIKKFFLKPLTTRDNGTSVSGGKTGTITGQKLAQEAELLENSKSIPQAANSRFTARRSQRLNQIITDQQTSNNIPEENTEEEDSIEEKYRALMEKKEEKRKKYNAYMREYMAKRKKEQKERENKVQIQFNNTAQLYNVEDVKNLLFSYINLFIEITKQNINRIPENCIEEINKAFTSNDFVSYGYSIQDAVKTIT